MTTPNTGLVWDELFLWHHAGGGAGPLATGGGLLIEPGEFGEETPHPRRRLRNLIEVSGLGSTLQWVAPRPATEDELLRVHTRDYVNQIQRLSLAGGGDAGGGTPFGPMGDRAARLAAGGCLRAVELVLDGAIDNAYALVKPPGHHASGSSGNGHCIFNNVALAAAHARSLGVARVSVVDWDVHWGNGTQEIFYADGAVQTISLHQADWYPRGGGSAGDVGTGEGLGAHINVPLPPGSGIGAYRAAFERVVVPAVRRHEPELVLVSCGFDAGANDPSGRMLLTSQDFRAMTRWTRGLAEELCGGKIVLCHEGGYSPTYVPFCGVAVIEELSGAGTVVDDPFLARYSGVGFEDLQIHQSSAIDDVVARHRVVETDASGWAR